MPISSDEILTAIQRNDFATIAETKDLTVSAFNLGFLNERRSHYERLSFSSNAEKTELGKQDYTPIETILINGQLAFLQWLIKHNQLIFIRHYARKPNIETTYNTLSENSKELAILIHAYAHRHYFAALCILESDDFKRQQKKNPHYGSEISLGKIKAALSELIKQQKYSADDQFLKENFFIAVMNGDVKKALDIMELAIYRRQQYDIFTLLRLVLKTPEFAEMGIAAKLGELLTNKEFVAKIVKAGIGDATNNDVQWSFFMFASENRLQIFQWQLLDKHVDTITSNHLFENLILSETGKRYAYEIAFYYYEKNTTDNNNHNSLILDALLYAAIADIGSFNSTYQTLLAQCLTTALGETMPQNLADVSAFIDTQWQRFNQTNLAATLIAMIDKKITNNQLKAKLSFSMGVYAKASKHWKNDEIELLCNDYEAQYMLGYMYLHGLGKEQNEAKANLFLVTSGQMGHRPAQQLMTPQRLQSAFEGFTKRNLWPSESKYRFGKYLIENINSLQRQNSEEDWPLKAITLLSSIPKNQQSDATTILKTLTQEPTYLTPEAKSKLAEALIIDSPETSLCYANDQTTITACLAPLRKHQGKLSLSSRGLNREHYSFLEHVLKLSQADDKNFTKDFNASLFDLLADGLKVYDVDAARLLKQTFYQQGSAFYLLTLQLFIKHHQLLKSVDKTKDITTYLDELISIYNSENTTLETQQQIKQFYQEILTDTKFNKANCLPSLVKNPPLFISLQNFYADIQFLRFPYLHSVATKKFVLQLFEDKNMPEILGAELHEMACNTITRQFENLYSAKHTIDPTLTELGNYLFTRSQKLVKQLGHNKIYQFFHRAEVKSRLNKNYLKVRLLSLTKVAEFQNPAASPDFLLDLATTLTEIFHEAIENKTAADLLGNFVENDNCIEGTSASYFGYADFLYGCYHLLLALNSETNPGYHQNSASIHLTRAAVAKVPFTMAKELLDISSNTNNNSVRGKISLECTAFDSDSITSTQLSLIIQNSEKHMSSIIKSIFSTKNTPTYTAIMQAVDNKPVSESIATCLETLLKQPTTKPLTWDARDNKKLALLIYTLINLTAKKAPVNINSNDDLYNARPRTTVAPNPQSIEQNENLLEL